MSAKTNHLQDLGEMLKMVPPQRQGQQVAMLASFYQIAV
jgi:hypothetical protein